MSKKMLMNATQHEENRVAIVEDGILTELDIEVAGHEPTKGNIYRAVVVRVESGLQAAFVDYGAGRLGFLQIDEINYKSVKPDYKASEDGRRPRITDLLQRGQELLVQIIKEERGTKGAALTTYLSLAGRYMVIMPESKTRGVSRKAESDSQRKELKQAMSSIDMAENIGYIVRTAALNQTREELERDYHYLIRLFESIKELNQKVKAPALLYKESNLVIRSIRDYFTTDMDEVLIDDPQVFKEARDFFQMVMPDQAKLVKLHQERRPIFSRYQIEDQIETLNRNKVPLPSGGSIVIDPTEALVAIDVNSGKMASEQGVEATATKSNLEAAREVGRQLRLRDLGGLVVIDFIDMRERKHAREVEKELKKSLENDKARVSVGRISQFGLLEMSRQRIKGVLAEGTYLTCPHCQGTGHLKSPETQAAALLRKIHASAAKGQISKIDAQLPLDVAAYLLNNKREDLVEMERDHHLQIHIHGNRDFLADQVELEITKKEKDKPAQPEYVAAGLLPAPAEESKSREDNKNQDESNDTNRKRQRRRRRKPAKAVTGDSSATSDANIQTTEDKENQESLDVSQGDSGQVNTSDIETPSKHKQQTTEQPRPRRGRPRKAPEAAVAKEENQNTADKQDSKQEQQATEQPKPRRGRPRKAPQTTVAKEENQTATDKPDSKQEQQTTEQTKPRRGRPRKAPQTTVAKEENQTTADKPGSKQEQQTTEQTKPRRGRPRKSPQTTVVKEENQTAVGKPDSKQEQQTPEQPRPRRGRPSKAPQKTVAKESPQATSDKPESTQGQQAAEQPKPRRGRPRKAPQQTVAKESLQATTGKPESKQGQQTTEQPKPRRGRPRKTPTSDKDNETNT